MTVPVHRSFSSSYHRARARAWQRQLNLILRRGSVDMAFVEKWQRKIAAEREKASR
jgi:hypothetical protein